MLYVLLYRETVDQFLIHCDAAYALRGDVFQRFGVQWVMPGDIVSLLFS